MGRFGRVGARLDGILLGRKSECVPAHRVEDVKALAALVPADDVGCSVSFGVPNVQARAGRVREHVETVEFRFGKIVVRLETLIVCPVLLPFGFNFFEVIIHRY